MSLRLSSGEARKNIRHHSLVKLLWGAAIIIAVAFVVCTVVSNSISIREKTEQYNELVKQTADVKEQNAQIDAYLNGTGNRDEYIENIARDKFGYANPDEKIYYVVPGN